MQNELKIRNNPTITLRGRQRMKSMLMNHVGFYTCKVQTDHLFILFIYFSPMNLMLPSTYVHLNP